ncbi:MAG: hypothetical protein GF334_11860 [Candidatus Altiarchaeales archaeon]|nr:hypothetical protein [Candidatus Altiarchaeales archaeon]
MRRIEGVLPHHKIECPFCLDYVQWCENCGEEEPCEECLSECPQCEGTGEFRWGSFYSEDTSKCDECGQEEVPIMHMDDDYAMLGVWICFDCYVLQHTLACPDCTLWRKWESIDQFFYQIEGSYLKHCSVMSGYDRIKNYVLGTPLVRKFRREISRLVKNRKAVEKRIKDLCKEMSKEDPEFGSEKDTPLFAYLLSLPEEYQGASAKRLLPHMDRLFWSRKLVREILSIDAPGCE